MDSTPGSRDHRLPSVEFHKGSFRLKSDQINASGESFKVRSKSTSHSRVSDGLISQDHKSIPSSVGSGVQSTQTSGNFANRSRPKSEPRGRKLAGNKAEAIAVARVADENHRASNKFAIKMNLLETQRVQCITIAKELMQKTQELSEKAVAEQESVNVPKEDLIPGTDIPKNFYVDAMLNILAEKWQNRKSSLAHSDKLAALRTKYEAVQKIINNVILAQLKESEQSDPVRKREFKKYMFRKLETQYDTSINRASTYRSTIGRRQDSILRKMEADQLELTGDLFNSSRLNLSNDKHSTSGTRPPKGLKDSFWIDHDSSPRNLLLEGSNSANGHERSLTNLKLYGINAEDFKNSSGFEIEKRRKDIKSTDKVLKDLRQKIDATYMKFAKRTGYFTLYKKEKEALAEDNQAFRANLRNFRRKKSISDNFLGGGFIEHLQPGILNNPLKNIYIETHKNKFDNPDNRFFDKEDKELFEEETKKCLAENLPEKYAYLQPKLLKILRETKHLDVSKQNIKAVRDVNQSQANPLSDTWRLNLFCKFKADKYYKNMDFPKKARHKGVKEDDEFGSKSSDGEEEGQNIRRLHIKEENEIDKFNSVNYMYAKSRSRKKASPAKSVEKPAEPKKVEQVQEGSKSQEKQSSSSDQPKIGEKKVFKTKIAAFYQMVDKFQSKLQKDNQKIDNDLSAKQNFLKQLSSAQDKSHALHKLVKDSIAETYDEVKNNSRASTIKRYVCSAKSYFKNSKKV